MSNSIHDSASLATPPAHSLKQVVKVPTRLNRDRTLDPIITSLSNYYRAPVTKPPINPDIGKKGKASNHLVVLMEPLASAEHLKPRIYRTIERRPLNQEGRQKFSKWIENCDWTPLYRCDDPNKKAEGFQKIIFDKYIECFPVKISKVSTDV